MMRDLLYRRPWLTAWVLGGTYVSLVMLIQQIVRTGHV